MVLFPRPGIVSATQWARLGSDGKQPGIPGYTQVPRYPGIVGATQWVRLGSDGKQPREFNVFETSANELLLGDCPVAVPGNIQIQIELKNVMLNI